MSFLQYIPFVLLFAAATALIYGWGLWRSQRQQQDLSNLLFSKGVSRIQKALKKQKQLSRQELEEAVKDLYAKQPFSSERIQITDPKQFLDSLLPYMLRHALREKYQLLILRNNSFMFILFCSRQRIRSAASRQLLRGIYFSDVP